MQYIKEYIDLVESGKIKTCADIKKLVALVKKAFETEDIYIDEYKVEKYLSYQKYFPFELFPWEKFVFILHNCVFYTITGLPRWSDLFVLMGRGGGKNGYLSFEDFCLITETNGIPQYDIDICANSEEQARTTFDEIYNILENPKFRKKFERNFRWTMTVIENRKTRSKIKYRTNNPKGKDGLRSGKVDFDEPHAYENWENINVFTTGLGKKPHPRRTYISTNGDVREGPLDQLLEKSEKILSGELEDNGFLPFICRLDDKKEVEDPTNWQKANPSLIYLPTLFDQMKREYADYELDPVTNNAFMTKRMNRPEGRKDQEVTSWENILKTNRELPDLTGKTCICGVDFSKTTDFMSVVFLFRGDGVFYVKHHSWLCTRSNDIKRLKIPLQEMVERGLLTMVDDVEIHPQIVADYIYEHKHIYDIDKIAIDDYRYALLSRELKEVGYEAKDKKVKLVRPSDIMRIQPVISSYFAKGGFIFGDDPLLRWFTNNAKLEPAPNNNFKYGKIEPKSRKTDGFMAFVAAMTLCDELPEEYASVFFEPLVF